MSFQSFATILFFGCLGGMSTVFGKIAFSADNLVAIRLQQECGLHLFADDQCALAGYVLRITGFVGIFVCNAIGLSYYLKAMEQNNTIVVVVLSSAANFLITGVLGKLIFGEILSRFWSIGSLLVMGGMCLVALSQGQLSERKE
jgi:drug/metabolite transporter (DMT)-like permease